MEEEACVQLSLYTRGGKGWNRLEEGPIFSFMLSCWAWASSLKMKLLQKCIYFICLTFQYEKVYQLSSEPREGFLSWDRKWETSFSEDILCLGLASVWFSEAVEDQAKGQGEARAVPFRLQALPSSWKLNSSPLTHSATHQAHTDKIKSGRILVHSWT